MALLFVPLLFGLRELFLWARPEVVAAQAILRHRQPYLNGPFFAARVIGYFVIWIGLSSLLSRWSLEQDRTAAPDLTRRLQRLSGPGLILYGLTVTFAAFDWVMTLGPQWHSTIFAPYFVAGAIHSGLAMVITLLIPIRRIFRLDAYLTQSHLENLAKLIILTGLIVGYSYGVEFFIAWYSANTFEQASFLYRVVGDYAWGGWIMLIFNAVIPLLFIVKKIRTSTPWLMAIAIMIKLNISNTEKSIHIGICETPSNAPLIPSTPYIKGSACAATCIQ